MPGRQRARDRSAADLNPPLLRPRLKSANALPVPTLARPLVIGRLRQLDSRVVVAHVGEMLTVRSIGVTCILNRP